MMVHMSFAIPQALNNPSDIRYAYGVHLLRFSMKGCTELDLRAHLLPFAACPGSQSPTIVFPWLGS